MPFSVYVLNLDLLGGPEAIFRAVHRRLPADTGQTRA